MPQNLFTETIMRRTGETLDSLKQTPIAQRRMEVEAKQKTGVAFKAYFPFIGRGNVMHDRTLSKSEVDRMVDRILGEADSGDCCASKRSK